jgi:alcohol dehydrogenase class IV
MLPAVLQWNAAVNEARQRTLSAVMGAPDRRAFEVIGDLILKLGLPRSLRAVGVQETSLEEIAQRALAYDWVRANPRPIMRVEDVKEILDLAW